MEDILLAVEECISHGTAPTYHQSPQEPQGVTQAWFSKETLHYLFQTEKPNFKLIISIP